MAKSTNSNSSRSSPHPPHRPVVLCAFVALAIASRAIALSPPRPPTTAERSPSRLAASAAAAAPIAPPPSYSVLFGLSLRRPPSEPLFAIPSIFNASDRRPVVLFDGKCNLCNAGVQLVLDLDRASSDPRGNLRVAALQSRVGRVLLARLPEEQRATVLSASGDGEYKSIVVAGEDRTWLNSAACLRIGRELKGPLRYVALLASLIPAFLRDPLYKLMSKYRKRLFGEAPECRLWDDNWDTRFVDDVRFGGRSEEVDPFADPNAPKEEDDEEDDDEDAEELPAGTPPHAVGDDVRVVGARPIVHAHVAGYKDKGGICSVGLTGRVVRVLDRQAYPRNVAVAFRLEGDGDDDATGGETEATSFEAHFFPGQLRKE